jgi:hypothetical protein
MDSELFDTSDYAPLFAGLPVAVPEDTGSRPTPIRLQMAMCCSSCGGEGPYLTTRNGSAICYTCAKASTKRRP